MNIGFVHGCFIRIPEQGAKTFLLKMPVVGENLRQPFPPRRLHRYVIRQAVSLVGTCAVEGHAGKKRLAALRNHADIGVVKNSFSVRKSFAAKSLVCRCKERQVFRQHFIRGDDGRAFLLDGKGAKGKFCIIAGRP